MNPFFHCGTAASRVVGAGLLLQAALFAQTGPCGSIIPGNPLPDFVVDVNRLKADLVGTREKFSDTSCSLVEGFVSSKGNHDLVRFTAAFANVGFGDLVIGDPNYCPSLYHLSECHGHFHFNDFAAYRLWTESGYNNWVLLRDAGAPANAPVNDMLLRNAAQAGDLLSGHKEGFCMIDDARYSSTASPTKRYTLCGGPGAPGNQGLQVGWEDIYAQTVDGQWVEADKLHRGRYVLEVQSNPNHVLPEANYSNNYGAVVFDYVPPHGNQLAVITIVP